MTEPVRAHFDRVAPVYETNRLGGWYIAHGRFIADRLEALTPPGENGFRAAVDVGCGTGWLLRELWRRGLIRRGVGLDLSGGMVRKARRRASSVLPSAEARPVEDPPLEFHRGAWPEPADEVWVRLQGAAPDLVLFASSLHYAPDVDSWLSRAFDLLTPGGRILILERAPERSLPTRVWGWLHELLMRDGARFVTTGALQAGLVDAGFEDVKTVEVLRRWLWHGKLVTSMALSTGVRSGTVSRTCTGSRTRAGNPGENRS